MKTDSTHIELSQIEERTINYILQEKSIDFLIDEGITTKYFPNKEKAYKYILNYIDRFGNVPDKASFFDANSDIEQLDIDGLTPGAIIDELRNQYITNGSINTLNDFRNEIVKLGTTSDSNITEIVTNAYNKLDKLLVDNQSINFYEYSSIPDLLKEKYVDIHDNLDRHYFKTGLQFLDEKFLGWNKDADYVVVSGRTGTGKSMLLCKFAATSWKNGLNVAYYSGEMTFDQVMVRMISALSGISSRAILSGKFEDEDANYERAYTQFLNEEYPKMKGTINILTPQNIGNRYANTNNLEAFCRKVKADILYVDQQSLMTDLEFSKTPFDKAANISRQIKALRDKLNIPIICAVQMNRKKLDGELELDTTQLAGSDVIGQDATKIIMMQSIFLDDDKKVKGIDLHIVKNRDGENFVNQEYKSVFDTCSFEPYNIDAIGTNNNKVDEMFRTYFEDDLEEKEIDLTKYTP